MDYLVAFVVALFALYGGVVGIIGTALSVVARLAISWFVADYLRLWLVRNQIAEMLTRSLADIVHVPAPTVALVAGTAIVIGIFLVTFQLLGMCRRRLLHAGDVGLVSRLLGAVVGALVGVAAVVYGPAFGLAAVFAVAEWVRRLF